MSCFFGSCIGDGDGYTCSEELAAGTNPSDASDHPEHEAPDTDGDGLWDAVDPTPSCPTWKTPCPI